MKTTTIEKTPGSWFCVVTNEDGSYNFETATKAGPCKTAKEAQDLMNYIQKTLLRRRK
jgi:hypothetical protein